MLFDGAKVDVAKPLNNEFQVSHKFRMGSATVPSTYQFGSIFVGQKV